MQLIQQLGHLTAVTGTTLLTLLNDAVNDLRGNKKISSCAFFHFIEFNTTRALKAGLIPTQNVDVKAQDTLQDMPFLQIALGVACEICTAQKTMFSFELESLSNKGEK